MPEQKNNSANSPHAETIKLIKALGVINPIKLVKMLKELDLDVDKKNIKIAKSILKIALPINKENFEIASDLTELRLAINKENVEIAQDLKNISRPIIAKNFNAAKDLKNLDLPITVENLKSIKKLQKLAIDKNLKIFNLEVTKERIKIVNFLMGTDSSGIKIVKKNIKKVHIEALAFLLEKQFKNNFEKIKKRHITAMKLLIKNNLIPKQKNKKTLEETKTKFLLVLKAVKQNVNITKNNTEFCMYLVKGGRAVNQLNVTLVNNYNLLCMSDSPKEIQEKLEAAEIIYSNHIKMWNLIIKKT